MKLFSPKEHQNPIQTRYPLIFIHGVTNLYRNSTCVDDGVMKSEKTKSIEGEAQDSSEKVHLSDATSEALNELSNENNKTGLKAQSSESTTHPSVQDDQLKSENFIKCYSLSCNHELDWPISSTGEVRIFAPLRQGRNLILLASGVTKEMVREFTVIYEPMQNERYVKPVYIVCEDSDGCFDAPPGEDNSMESALKRISFNARILQTFMAENLKLHGFGRNTFKLAEDKDGNVQVDIFRSKLGIEKSQHMTGDELYGFFRQELVNSSLYDPMCKFWAFMSCTHYKPPVEEDSFDRKKIQEYITGHTALGGQNMALFGTGCLHTWAEDLAQLSSRFHDNRIIDCKELFDDSCGRGYYWANYSSTLGAAMHELGHTFNLPHTPSGIMSRGFDDMNCFFTCQTSTKESDALLKFDSNTMLSPYRDKGAHWHRSSAVSLKYCKWIGNKINSSTDEHPLPVMSSSPETRGPVGGGCYINHSSVEFDSRNWLSSQNLQFGGLRVKAGKYVFAIQFIGRKQGEDNCPVEILSPWHGNGDIDEKQYEFSFDFCDEKLVSIDVRAGEWIDGIRIHSNYKSSVWFGGNGGNLYTLKSVEQLEVIESLFGNAADFVMSLGISLTSTTVKEKSLQAIDNFHFYAPHGVRNVEALNKEDEVVKHWEYIEQVPRNCIMIPNNDILMEGRTKSVAIYDDAGEMSTFYVDNFSNKYRTSASS